MSNLTFPTEFIYENLMIQTNLLKAALDFKVKKTIFLGTSCIYPKFSKTPIKDNKLELLSNCKFFIMGNDKVPLQSTLRYIY